MKNNAKSNRNMERQVKEANMRRREDSYIIIASQLSLQSKFMQYEPKTEAQRNLKANLEQLIQGGISDIEVTVGMLPFAPSAEAYITSPFAGGLNIPMATRLTDANMDSILGCILNQIVEEANWAVEEAWDAVCNDLNSMKLLTHFVELRLKKDFETDIWWLLRAYFAMPLVRKVPEDPLSQYCFYDRFNCSGIMNMAAVGALVLD